MPLSVIWKLLIDAAVTSALTSNPTGDVVGSVQGLISRMLGPSYVSKFTIEVINGTAGPGGFVYDTFEYQSAGTWPGVLLGCTSTQLFTVACITQEMAPP
jgi:hypothetical protein